MFWKPVTGPAAGTHVLLEKQHCKAQSDSFSLSGPFRAALAPGPPCTKYNRKVIDLCQQPMQNRVENTQHQSTISSFLPLLLLINFLLSKKKKTIHFFSNVRSGPLSSSAADFRRSLQIFSCAYPQNKPVTSAPTVIIDVFRTSRILSEQGSIFTPLRMSMGMWAPHNDATTINVHVFCSADGQSDQWQADFQILNGVVNWLDCSQAWFPHMLQCSAFSCWVVNI